MIAQTAGTFLAAALVPLIVRTVGKKQGYLSFGAVAIVAGIGLSVAPASTPSYRLHLLLRDWHRPGRRQRAHVGARGRHGRVRRVEDRHPHGGRHLFRSPSPARWAGPVGGAAAAYTIGFGGYVAQSETQPDSAINAIKIAAGVVPAAVVFIALAIMFAYPLTESRFREIVREVAQRRVARQVEAARSAPSPAITTGGTT